MANVQMVDIDTIVPAKYNPRKISDEQFEQLQESIRTLGFILPVIINKKNNTIIGGHQRTKAARAVGIKQVPAIYIDGIMVGDEIRFNQLHNGTDISNLQQATSTLDKIGFFEADHNAFSISRINAPSVNEISKLILKYGNAFCSVVCAGRVIYGVDYVKCYQVMKIPVNVSVIESDKLESATRFLSQGYGTYSYDAIKRDTFVQGLAQMHRSVQKRGKSKQNASSLYVDCVIPDISDKRLTILDFGCGEGAYISYLKRTHDAVGVEFFNHDGSKINVKKGNQMIDALIQHIRHKGRFDVVVCDSVLNSVDSIQAEKAVVTCCNLFCKDTIYISGRKADVGKSFRCKTQKNSQKCFCYFLDENKFTATYRKGHWYFQHFHDEEDIVSLMNSHGFQIVDFEYSKYSDAWHVKAKKIAPMSPQEYIDALRFEFNLPLPKGSYCRDEDVISACKDAGLI